MGGGLSSYERDIISAFDARSERVVSETKETHHQKRTMVRLFANYKNE